MTPIGHKIEAKAKELAEIWDGHQYWEWSQMDRTTRNYWLYVAEKELSSSDSWYATSNASQRVAVLRSWRCGAFIHLE